LAVAVGVFLWTFDWNWFRDLAEKKLAEQTGRDVGIGHMQGEWSLRPRIKMEEIRLGNADWAEQPDMLSAERLEVVIDLPELLRGRLVLPEIHLITPKLFLQRRKDGVSNWTFGAEEAAKKVKPEKRSSAPLIGLLVIQDGTLSYRDEKAELDITSQISTAVGDGSEGKSQLRLEGRGRLHREPFELKVSGASLLELRESKQPYPLTVEMTAGQTHIRISGTLAEPVRFEGLDLDVHLNGPNLGQLTRITSVPLPMTPAYDLKGRLQRDGSVWSIENLDGQVGRSDLQGDLRIDTGGDRLRLDANLRSQTLDYRDLGPLIGIEPPANARKDRQQRNEAAKPYERQSRNPPAANAGPPPRVLPDAALATEQIRNTDASVKFHGDKVVAPNTPFSGVDLALDLHNGVLHLHPLKLGIAGGFVNTDIRIDASKNPVTTNYDLRLSKFDLQQFLEKAGLKNAGSGQIDGRIRMTGQGDTIRRSLGSAGGDVRLTMNHGTLSKLALELIGLNVGEAAALWAGGDAPAPIRCFIADFTITGGVMKPRVLVLDTPDTTITADGQISLKDEQLGMRLLAHPKKPRLLSARTPITINGAFSRPDVGIAPARLGAKIAGAVALGALLTPIASILAFIEPGLEQNSDCAALLQDSGSAR
jgi:uncharacterized protein involved in outer membrane biogenesis